MDIHYPDVWKVNRGVAERNGRKWDMTRRMTGYKFTCVFAYLRVCVFVCVCVYSSGGDNSGTMDFNSQGTTIYS